MAATNITPTASEAAPDRATISDILGRHRGAKAEIARLTGTTPPQVSKWLAGTQSSARVADACTLMAAKLLDQEALISAGVPVKKVVVPRKTGPRRAVVRA